MWRLQCSTNKATKPSELSIINSDTEAEAYKLKVLHTTGSHPKTIVNNKTYRLLET